MESKHLLFSLQFCSRFAVAAVDLAKSILQGILPTSRRWSPGTISLLFRDKTKLPLRAGFPQVYVLLAHFLQEVDPLLSSWSRRKYRAPQGATKSRVGPKWTQLGIMGSIKY
jgi:hypothetical protein